MAEKKNRTIKEWEMKQERLLFIEKCIYCGAEVDVPMNLHIDFRENYVEGAGQLCSKCYKRIYND